MASRITDARKAAGLTQKQLGEIIGVKPSTVAGYEAGTADPKSDGLIAIANACGCTVDYLLSLADDPSGYKKTAPLSEDNEAVSEEQVYEILVSRGYIRRGQDLSDSDLRFLESLAASLDAWFK